jgi:hypothetical protein
MTEMAGHSWSPSRLIVLITGVALGVFAWRTYIDEVPSLYPVTFEYGQWLVGADDAPQGYFRRELYIPETIQQAWVIVAATDSFTLYVNGKAVDGKGYASLNVSGIYDIGPYLAPGKNVVGLKARRLSYPGAAMAALEGVYRDHTGRQHTFATDGTWKSSPVERTQGGGEISWYDGNFDATAWPLATTAARPPASQIYPLDVHPFTFAMPPQGQWIGQEGLTPTQATFSHTLTLPEKVEDAWLRIAAGKPYTLAINGVTLEQGDKPRDAEVMRLVRFQNAARWNSQGEVSTDLYRLTPLLCAGINRISVTSGQRFSAFPGLFVDGFIVSEGEVLPFGSDATWSVSTPSFVPPLSPEPHHAVVLAHLTAVYNALPLKQVMSAGLPVSYVARQLLTLALVLLGTTSSVYLLWLGSSRLLHALGRGDLTEAGRVDALAHLPTLLTLGSLYLLSYDVRLDPAFPFRSRIVVLAVAALLICKALILLEAWYRRQPTGQVISSASVHLKTVAGICPLIFLIGLTAVGAFLRLQNLDTQSLYHDEIHMVTYVQGLLEKGYPHKMIGPIERSLATYELAPYPIALSVMLLGLSDFALRLPAALFGIMTIPLIFLVGQQVFDRRVGLLAAAVYTFCPQALIWAQYLWHPQQTQFLALLTSYLFYMAIRRTPISPRFLYPAAAAFIATYLSWEGSGFFLPALGLGLAVVKGKDLSWLRDKHLWIAVGLITVAVAAQLIRRLLLQIQYLVVGQGLSDVSMPTLYFLDPMYDPMFYVKNFLWLENNVLLTLLIVITLPMLYKRSGSAYYCTLLFTIIFLMTNTLANSATRYVYYLQPFLIVLSSMAVFIISDVSDNILANRYLLIHRSMKIIVALGCFIFISLSSSMFLKLFRLSDFSYPSGVHTRDNIYYIDYRTPSTYVKSHYLAGDLVIAVVADALSHYTSLESSYFFQHYTMRQVFYDPSGQSSRYLERIVGNPVITELTDMKEIMSNYKRIWIIASPDKIFLRMVNPEVKNFINQSGGVVYESYNSKVYLISN